MVNFVKGYNGQILYVDLTKEKTWTVGLDEATARKYIGGAGLCAKIIWDETSASTDPFSPENPFIIMSGPMTGTNTPQARSRFVVGALSPLTGIYGQSHVGGRFGDQLKHAGLDGIVVKGRAMRPVYVWVKNGEAEIRDADHLLGKDVIETAEILMKQTDKRASTVAIGLPGERLVRISCPMFDGRLGRAAARGGLGAVMGSKNLKAIAVRGTIPPKVHDEERFKKSTLAQIKKLSDEYKREKQEKFYFRYEGEGAPPGVKPPERKVGSAHGPGDVSFRNFRDGTFQGKFLGLGWAEGDMAKYDHIWNCPGCVRPLCGDACRYVEDGTMAPTTHSYHCLGGACLIDDFEAIGKATVLLQKHGMDCISTGHTISFAMECFEKGLITKEEADGIDLRWGNADAMVEMVRKIIYREGYLGRLLGEGTRRAADQIGGTAPEYAMHVKGLELTGRFEPRNHNYQALGYAVSIIGASQHAAEPYFPGEDPGGDLKGFREREKYLEHRFEVEGVGAGIAKGQDRKCMIDSLILCQGNTGSTTIRQYIEYLNYLRMINVRRGTSGKDDVLPLRLLTQKREDMPYEDNLPPLGELLSDYYAAKGWSEEGIPTRAKLKELDLEDIADELEKLGLQAK
jgi:aldehyde:ferredoxin oxidoreductase